MLPMAMENNELLEALRHIIKEETRAAVKEEVQPIKDDINSINIRLDNMDSRLDNMESDISEIKKRTVKIEVTLENEIRPNIQLMMEGHKGIVDTMHDIKKDTVETELFATKEVTKDNVQNIKKLQSKRKI